MLHDIQPHQFKNDMRSKLPDSNDYLLLYCGNKVLMDCRGEAPQVPLFFEVQNACPAISDTAIYLFAVDEYAFYHATLPLPPQIEGYKMTNTEVFRETQPA